MTVTDYQQWRADGSPWRPAAFIRTFAATMRGHGYTVGTIGAISTHLDIPYPQDHAPYSHTPWPGSQPYPLVLACDVMDDGPVDLPTLGEQLVADKNAGVPGTQWIKYLNWTDKHGVCWDESWKPGPRRSPSGDRGHIHISGRTDYVDQETAYDPIARILKPTPPGPTPPPTPRPVPQHAQPGSRTLFFGNPLMRGADAAFVQRYIGPKECGPADGVYGRHTEAGVKWYQDMREIHVDGVVGPQTWHQLGVV